MTPFLTLTAGSMRWTIHPRWRNLLLGPAGLRLDDWLLSGATCIVKQGPHRTVYRVALPGLDCHIKHNRLWNLRAWLRELLRPPKARIEFQRACLVAARGIDTIEPIALGETVGLPGDSFLITRSLDDTQQLNAFLETVLPTLAYARQVRLRQTLAHELGRFLRRLHDQGIVHHDLHPGNLLLRLEPGDVPRFFLVDLHMVRVGGPLGHAARQANLVLFNHWFSMKASRSDRLRFWRSYAAQGAGASGPESVSKREADRLERLTLHSKLRFWRSRDWRCLGSNRYFQRLKRDGVAGHAVRDLPDQVLERLLANPDAPFERADAIRLKDSRSSTVVELAAAGRRLIYKRFRVKSWRDPWLALVRPTGALRSWIEGHALLDRAIPTARPLAVLERRRHGLPAEGYLLVEKIDDALDLRRWLQAHAAERRRLRSLIDRLARLIRALHERRLSHRDLKASNILVQDRPGADPEPWLIDLVGARRHRQLGRRRRVQNLARLNASFLQSAAITRTDRLRFLRIYLQWALKGRAGWKRWWQQIEAASLAKAARNQRRGRMLA